MRRMGADVSRVIREMEETYNAGKPFKGVSVAMIITCVMAMAFMGFAGMVTIQ